MIRKVLIVLSFVAFTGSLFAWGVPSTSSVTGDDDSAKTKSVDLSGLTKSKEKYENAYLESTKAFAKSMLTAYDAIGVKTEATKKLAEINDMKSGSVDTDKLHTVTAEAAEELEIKLAEAKSIDKEAGKKIGTSMIQMGDAVIKEKTLISGIKTLATGAADAAKNASGMDKMNAVTLSKAAISLSTVVPSDISIGTKVLKAYKKFATTNNITLPKNATKALPNEG